MRWCHPEILEVDAIQALVLKLIKSAREVRPALLPDVAKLYMHLFESNRQGGHGPTERRDAEWAQISENWNFVLAELAVPNVLQPVSQMPLHYEAQQILLKGMRAWPRPLSLNRRGFRAIASVSVGLPRSDSEKQWAKLQTKSWPPWKQPRLGIEAEDIPGEDESKTWMILQRAEMAGFPSLHFEQALAVLGGRDLDGTPTVQRRALLRGETEAEASRSIAGIRNLGSRSPQSFRGAEAATCGSDFRPGYWEAKVKATRTLQEAWAMFLDYTDSHKPSPQVHRVMLRKLLQAEAAESHAESGEDGLGDSDRIFSPLLNPDEGIFVATPPPSSIDFIQQALKLGLGSSGAFLGECMKRIDSYQTAHSIIEWNKARPMLAEKSILEELKAGMTHHPHAVAQLTDRAFTPFIGALVRLVALPDDTGYHTRFQRTLHRFALIEQCLVLRRWKSAPAWNLYLGGLAAEIERLSDHTSNTGKMVMLWWRMHRILHDSSDASKIAFVPTLSTVRPVILSHRCVMKHLVRNNSFTSEFFERDSASGVQAETLSLLNAWFRAMELNSGARTDYFGRASRLFDLPDSGSGHATTLATLIEIPDARDLRFVVQWLSTAHEEEGLMYVLGFIDAYSDTLRAHFVNQERARQGLGGALGNLEKAEGGWSDRLRRGAKILRSCHRWLRISPSGGHGDTRESEIESSGQPPESSQEEQSIWERPISWLKN